MDIIWDNNRSVLTRERFEKFLNDNQYKYQIFTDKLTSYNKLIGIQYKIQEDDEYTIFNYYPTTFNFLIQGPNNNLQKKIIEYTKKYKPIADI